MTETLIRNILVVILSAAILVVAEERIENQFLDEVGFWIVVPLALGAIGKLATVGAFPVRLLSVISIPLIVGLYFLRGALAPDADADALGLLAFFTGYWMLTGVLAFFLLWGIARLGR